MLSVRTHAAVAALSLAFAAHSPAMAADQGEKCEGFNRLLCLPMAAAASVGVLRELGRQLWEGA